MHALEAVQIRHNLPLLCIEYDKLVSVHVPDVESPVLGIKALVVKAHRRSWHRNVGHLYQYLIASCA